MKSFSDLKHLFMQIIYSSSCLIWKHTQGLSQLVKIVDVKTHSSSFSHTLECYFVWASILYPGRFHVHYFTSYRIPYDLYLFNTVVLQNKDVL